jgi:quinol monooxygenase YgiN
MLIVLGSVQTRPETLDEARRLALAHVQRSRAEQGCLAHAVHTDLDDPLRLVFIERWADWAALHTHFRVPDSVAFAQDMARLAAQPPDMAVHQVSASHTPLAPKR